MSEHVWTEESKLLALLALPWSISVSEDAADGSLIAEVGEIPDAIATGDTEKALAIDLWESLKASLAIRLENEDPIPLPAGISALPWLAGPPGPSSGIPPVLGQPLRVMATATAPVGA
jgi:predicted RNase H-like HicB family nuclease